MIKTLLLSLFAVLFGCIGFVYSGLYPIGADTQHTKFTYWTLETLRERSIARSSRHIVVPDLSDPALLLSGGADYDDMCSSCHLKPGVSQSDMSIGLYPSPPNLANKLDDHGHDHSAQMTEKEIARRNFWIIKHGIKASGMPAWGPTHNDARIWGMVAFVEKLHTLNEIQYQVLTTRRKNAEL